MPCCSSRRTISACPRQAATDTADAPPDDASCTAAPASISSCATAAWLWNAAHIKADMPFLLWASTPAPLSSSALTASAWPLAAAAMSGVQPICSRRSTSAPFSSSGRSSSVRPLAMAQCRGPSGWSSACCAAAGSASSCRSAARPCTVHIQMAKRSGGLKVRTPLAAVALAAQHKICTQPAGHAKMRTALRGQPAQGRPAPAAARVAGQGLALPPAVLAAAARRRRRQLWSWRR